jgi:hypothetical protein
MSVTSEVYNTFLRLCNLQSQAFRHFANRINREAEMINGEVRNAVAECLKESTRRVQEGVNSLNRAEVLVGKSKRAIDKYWMSRKNSERDHAKC